MVVRWIAPGLLLFQVMLVFSEEPLHPCVWEIAEAYGTKDLKEILVEAFREWEPLVATAVKNTKLKPTPVQCIAKCRQHIRCTAALDKLDGQRSIKSIIRRLFAAKSAIKLCTAGPRVFLGSIIGTVADLVQFYWHMEYMLHGQLVGAGGNLVYGAMIGSEIGGFTQAIIGGATGLGMWVFSEYFYYKFAKPLPGNQEESWYLSYNFQVFLFIATVVLINITYQGLSKEQGSRGNEDTGTALTKIALLLLVLCVIFYSVYFP